MSISYTSACGFRRQKPERRSVVSPGTGRKAAAAGGVGAEAPRAHGHGGHGHGRTAAYSTLPLPLSLPARQRPKAFLLICINCSLWCSARSIAFRGELRAQRSAIWGGAAGAPGPAPERTQTWHGGIWRAAARHVRAPGSTCRDRTGRTTTYASGITATTILLYVHMMIAAGRILSRRK